MDVVGSNDDLSDYKVVVAPMLIFSSQKLLKSDRNL